MGREGCLMLLLKYKLLNLCFLPAFFRNSPPPTCPQGNVKLLMDDVAALRPTLFMAVPRILERVEDGGGWQTLCMTCRACAVVCMLCCTCAAWSICRGRRHAGHAGHAVHDLHAPLLAYLPACLRTCPCCPAALQCAASLRRLEPSPTCSSTLPMLTSSSCSSGGCPTGESWR